MQNPQNNNFDTQDNNNNQFTNNPQNPNYRYSSGIDSDYNQLPDNQFPPDFFQSNPGNPNPQNNFTPNSQPNNFDSNNQVNSWHAFTPTQTGNSDISDNQNLPNNSAETWPNQNNFTPIKPTDTNTTHLVIQNPESNSDKNPQPKENLDKESAPQIRTKSGVTGLLIAVLILMSIISIASSSVVAGLVSYYLTNKQLEENSQKNSAIAEVTTTRTTDEQSAIIDAVTTARESVVSVIVSRQVASSSRNQFFNDSEDSGSTRSLQVGAGSGFVVTSQGYILTNKHVVEDTRATYSIVLDDGSEIAATVLGRYPLLDIAILKVDPSSKLKPIKLGDSNNIKAGQTVIAIGNSLGEFSNSVSRGVISGLGRTIQASNDKTTMIETLENVIQTDASINPGNSGGPLLDVNGLVIGVNVAKSGEGENVAFSIPINDVKQILETVIATGKLQRPYLGIQYLLVDKNIAEQEKLSVDYGAYIVAQEGESAIAKDSPASKADIKEKDIILEINGSRITPENDLRKLVQKAKVGDTLTLKILRDKQEIQINVTLEELK